MRIMRKLFEDRQKRKKWNKSGPQTKNELYTLFESNPQDKDLVKWAWNKFVDKVHLPQEFVSILTNRKFIPMAIRELAVHELMRIVKGNSRLPCMRTPEQAEANQSRRCTQLAAIYQTADLRQELRDSAYELAIEVLPDEEKRAFCFMKSRWSRPSITLGCEVGAR